MKFSKIAAAMAVLLIAFMAQCGPEVRETNGNTTVTPQGDDSTALKEEYRREGFISGGVFRVVIVEPGDADGGESLARAGVTARKRAYLSLKKYLISSDRIVTPNVDASLLNLIEQEGRLNPVQESGSLTRKVYLFEIEKPGLKGYIDGLAPKR